MSNDNKELALGLVCITASAEVRFRTMTRKRLLQFSSIEQEQRLRNLYQENLQRLDQAITFCQRQGIRLYRLSSALFPFSDDALGTAVLNEFVRELAQVSDRARAAFGWCCIPISSWCSIPIGLK